MYQHGQGLTKDLHLAKRYYDKAVEADQDAAIPVFMALAKLCFDFAVVKLEEMFTKEKLSGIVSEISMDKLEVGLVHYFGDHWDVIAITILSFVGAFVMAWRRQNALLYRRMRAAELQRLQEVQRSNNDSNDSENKTDAKKEIKPMVEEVNNSTGDVDNSNQDNNSSQAVENSETN